MAGQLAKDMHNELSPVGATCRGAGDIKNGGELPEREQSPRDTDSELLFCRDPWPSGRKVQE